MRIIYNYSLNLINIIYFFNLIKGMKANAELLPKKLGKKNSNI